MVIYNSGYFLRVILTEVVDRCGGVNERGKLVFERLRSLKGKNPKMNIWPKLGFSPVIEITCDDSIPLSVWKSLKTEIKEIIENSGE